MSNTPPKIVRTDIGEFVEGDLNPSWEESVLLFIAREYESERTSLNAHPSFWFEFKGQLYYGVVDYNYSFLETMEDWDYDEGIYGQKSFSAWYEYDERLFYMLNNFIIPTNKVENSNEPRKTFYIKVDYNRLMSGDLGKFSGYELDIIETWYKKYSRDEKLKNLLSK